jgi:uncharacterized membrane protein YecN with MAPEG domain
MRTYKWIIVCVAFLISAAVLHDLNMMQTTQNALFAFGSVGLVLTVFTLIF